MIQDTVQNSINPSEALAALSGLGGDNSSFMEELNQMKQGGENTHPAAPENTDTNIDPLANNGAVVIEDDKTIVPEGGNEEEVLAIYGKPTSEVFKEEQPSQPSDEINLLFSEFEVTDVTTLKEKIVGLRESAQEKERIKAEYDNVDAALKSAPPELYLALTKALKGEDWREVLKEAPTVDFRADVENVESKALVESFFPNEFSNEDWEDFKSGYADPATVKAINFAINASKEKFTAKRSAYLSDIENESKKSSQYQENFNKSLDTTVSNLKKEFEGIDEGYLSGVVNKISKEGIVSHFYNEDGTLKENAATSFLRSTEDYEKIVKARINAAVKAERNRLTQEMLDRGSDVPNIRRNTNSSKDELRPEVKKVLDDLAKL